MNYKKLSLCLLALVIALIVMNIRSCGKIQTKNDLYRATQDSLRKSVDMIGREFSMIRSLKSESKKDLIKLETNDSTIQWLQKLVKNYEGKLNSAVVLSNRTNSSGVTKTRVDTVFITDNECWPIYSTSWENDWEVGWIKAGRDSIEREIKIRNEFEITMGDVSNGLFKERTSTVSILNLNPNTLTSELRSFEIEHKQKKVGLGLHVGLSLNSELQPTPYVGIGFDYRLLGIK